MTHDATAAAMPRARSSAAKLQTVDAMLDNFFKHALLAKLVERAVITTDDAREIAAGAATFAHEIADDPSNLHAGILAATPYELISKAFPPGA